MELPARLPLRLYPLSHGYHNAVWDYRPPAGHTIEHMLHPDYFAHALQSSQVRPNDEIRCIAEDRSYYVQLFVMDVDPARQWAKLIMLQCHWQDVLVISDSGEPAADPDGYKIQFSGPHKWRILSPAGAIVGKGYTTRDDAVKALAGMKPARAA